MSIIEWQVIIIQHKQAQTGYIILETYWVYVLGQLVQVMAPDGSKPLPELTLTYHQLSLWH